jgi:thiol-disulfide isomerase/thioredoxin
VVAIVACAIVAGTYYVIVLRHAALPTAREAAFHNVALTTEDGHSFDATQFGKKPVVVATWATWCPSCTEMLITLGAVKETFGDRIEVIAVNRKEEKSTIDSFRQAVSLPKNITYVTDGADAYFKNSDGRSMPEILVYDKEGKMTVHALAALSKDELVKALQDLLPK